MITEINKNEHEILEHMAKLVNQRGISLWQSFTEIDLEKQGFFNEEQFDKFLTMLGIDLSENEGQVK